MWKTTLRKQSGLISLLLIQVVLCTRKCRNLRKSPKVLVLIINSTLTLKLKCNEFNQKMKLKKISEEILTKKHEQVKIVVLGDKDTNGSKFATALINFKPIEK